MKVKIGEIIQFNRDMKIHADNGELLVRRGDRAQVLRKVDDGTGEILYLTGEAKGKSQIVSIEVDEEIDSDDIAKKINNMLM